MEDVTLGELLILMVNAHRSFRTLRGEVRTWSHSERQHEAFMRTRAARIASGSALTVAPSREGSEPAPVEWEHLLRVWLAPPERLREELVTMRGEGSSVATNVHVGTTWWSYDADRGAHTNGGAPDSQVGVHLQRALIDPSRLLASRALELRGYAVHAGRRAIRVRATPSPPETFAWEQGAPRGEWPQELLVDAERGIVLRCVSLLDGEPFAIAEFLSVAFDETFPEDTFVFTPPAGQEVRDVREALAGHLGPMSLQQAVERAPFAIYLPRRVPGDWGMRVYFSEADERGRWPAVVHVHYTNDDTTVHVNLNLHAAADMDIPSCAPDGSAWHVEHTDHGPLSIWEPDGGERGMPRIAMIEIAGTRIQISTDDLDTGAIAKLAASLAPAPPAPPTP